MRIPLLENQVDGSLHSISEGEGLSGIKMIVLSVETFISSSRTQTVRTRNETRSLRDLVDLPNNF